jgi:hypothetical protein
MNITTPSTVKKIPVSEKKKQGQQASGRANDIENFNYVLLMRAQMLEMYTQMLVLRITQKDSASSDSMIHLLRKFCPIFSNSMPT